VVDPLAISQISDRECGNKVSQFHKLWL
jgi:hypothetical protein